MSGQAAQTSAISLKAASSMTMLGMMPSGEPRAAWATWLQGLYSPHGRRRRTLQVCSWKKNHGSVPSFRFQHLVFAAAALMDVH
mmetsp:Transcript_7161/g.14636  ORF Transcript_7161/g.14636 Transcript_7161/m.14636 type:complete len:84 (+) Transcript_7161:123-374(+)